MFKLFPLLAFYRKPFLKMSIEHAQHHHLWPLTSLPWSNISLSRGLFFGDFFFYLYIFLTVFLFYLSFLFDFYFHVSSWAFGVMNLSFWRNHFWKWLWNWVSNFLRNFFIKISSCFTYNIIYNEDKYHSIL